MAHDTEWFEMDYWEVCVSRLKPLRVRRQFFGLYWAIEGRVGPTHEQDPWWQPFYRVWRRDTAIAKAVELKLRGFNIEL